jgi:hypothetical protein
VTNKIFYLLTAEHEALDETKIGIPEDAYSGAIFVVAKAIILLHSFILARQIA